MSMSSTLWTRDQNQLPVREHLLLLLLCIDADGGNDCEMATLDASRHGQALHTDAAGLQKVVDNLVRTGLISRSTQAGRVAINAPRR